MLLIDLCILICWQAVDPLRRTVERYSMEVSTRLQQEGGLRGATPRPPGRVEQRVTPTAQGMLLERKPSQLHMSPRPHQEYLTISISFHLRYTVFQEGQIEGLHSWGKKKKKKVIELVEVY